MLQKRDNLRATSNKDVENNVCTAFKTEKEKIRECVIEIIIQQQFITNLSVGCLLSRLLWHYHSFSNTGVRGSKSETVVQCSACHSISVFTFYLLYRRKCTYSRTCMCFPTSSAIL